MANILNQDEIDSLLGAMARGEIDKTEENKDSGDVRIKEYNFRRPSLVTKDQLRSFTNIHENFARDMVAATALMLRTNVEFSLVSSEQQQYSEFVGSLSKISSSVVFSAEPLPGLAVLEVNLSLIFGICDLLLGGKGNVETEIRKPTDIEMSIVTPFIDRLIDTLRAAWATLIKVNLLKTRHETDPEYIQAAPLDAPVVVMAFDAKIGLANGIINICYPLPMIQAFIEYLEGTDGQMDSYYGRKADDETRGQVLEAILAVPLRTNVRLGTSRIRGSEMLSLSPGDIILLDTRISDPVSVSIEGRRLYTARPGRNDERLCIRLNKKIQIKEDPSVIGISKAK
jgi:flagellar motor switch protein FliM